MYYQYTYQVFYELLLIPLKSGFDRHHIHFQFPYFLRPLLNQTFLKQKLKTCYVIDAGNSYNMLSFASHQSFVNAISFDRAFETVRIFSCAEDATIAVSELSGTAVTAIGPFAKPLRELACFPKLMVGVDSDGTIMCWRRAPTE